MPYLNEARVIGAMAMEPEMSMLKNGVPYCYFAVRMVQRTPDGEVAEDYIRVIAYGDTAVLVARDMSIGDLALCVGRLSPKQWRNTAGHEEYQLHFVAETVERLATGDGMLPPVTINEAANAKAAAFRCDEDEFIHSDTFRFRGARDPRPPKLFEPQPISDGTWTIPEEYVKQESLDWIEREKERTKRKREQFGIASVNAEPAVDMAQASRIAASLISWNLPVTNDGQYVRIPNAKCLPVEKYAEILRGQDALLAKQTPQMRNAIVAMAVRRGVAVPGMQLQQPKPVQPDQPSAINNGKTVVGSSDPISWFKD